MRITLFDCLDSFTWNLVHDLERAGARVRVVEEGQWQPSDWAQTDALVLSPGPGLPEEHPQLLDVLKEAVDRLEVGRLEEAMRATKLTWVKNELDNEDAKVVAYLVATSNSLEALVLGINQLGNEGTKAICEAICYSDSLKELDLRQNNIGDQGAKAFAASGVSLTKLSLGENNFGDEGVTALAAGLAASSSLIELTLSKNNVGDNRQP